MDKALAWMQIALAALGTLSIFLGAIAKHMRPGKARDIARDLGMRFGDAAGVVRGALPKSKRGQP